MADHDRLAELVNFQPPRKNPYFDADPKPEPYSQLELAREALAVACGEINTILVAGRRDAPTPTGGGANRT